MPIKRKKDKGDGTRKPVTRNIKRVCAFCESKTEPEFTDSVSLKRYISDRSRIMPRARTGACSKHQRGITKQIKYARHLALLPFVNEV